MHIIMKYIKYAAYNKTSSVTHVTSLKPTNNYISVKALCNTDYHNNSKQN